MPISYPSSPTVGQTYSYGSSTWQWNGYAWDNISSSSSYYQTVSSAATTGVAGTPVTQRTKLNFVNATVTDDSTNNQTNVILTGGASVTISDTAPSSPSAGNLWFKSSTGQTFIYYSSVWVEIGATGGTTATVVSANVLPDILLYAGM